MMMRRIGVWIGRTGEEDEDDDEMMIGMGVLVMMVIS